MTFRRLSKNERYQIEDLLASGFSIRGIARELERSASTIHRELARNG